jgi:hypothetical protein
MCRKNSIYYGNIHFKVIFVETNEIYGQIDDSVGNLTYVTIDISYYENNTWK